MQLEDIQLMFDYNNWANGIILAKAAELTPEQFAAPTSHSWGSLHGTLVHTLDTEWSWRILLDKGELIFEEMKPDNFPTIEALAARWSEERAAWHTYLNRLTDADMTSIVRYTVPEGDVRTRVLWHCLYHVVNHGMQHRSEAAHILTAYGQSPGDIDFSVFTREWLSVL